MDLLPRPVVLKFILKRKTCVTAITTALVSVVMSADGPAEDYERLAPKTGDCA